MMLHLHGGETGPERVLITCCSLTFSWRTSTSELAVLEIWWHLVVGLQIAGAKIGMKVHVGRGGQHSCTVNISNIS